MVCESVNSKITQQKSLCWVIFSLRSRPQFLTVQPLADSLYIGFRFFYSRHMGTVFKHMEFPILNQPGIMLRCFRRRFIKPAACEQSRHFNLLQAPSRVEVF